LAQCKVTRTGPDRLVQPVQLGTGEWCGPIIGNKPRPIEPAKNRSKPGWTGRISLLERVLKLVQDFPYFFFLII